MSENSDAGSCAAGGFFFLIVLIGLGSLCLNYIKSCNDSRESKRRHAAMEIEKQSYLVKYNPSLKSLRDKLEAEQQACSVEIIKLENIKLGFKQEGSKKIVQEKIDEFHEIRKKLMEQYSHVDEEAEKGLAMVKINQIDGGGLVQRDISQLLNESKPILELSQSARQRMASEMGQASVKQDESGIGGSGSNGGDLIASNLTNNASNNSESIAAKLEYQLGKPIHQNEAQKQDLYENKTTTKDLANTFVQSGDGEIAKILLENNLKIDPKQMPPIPLPRSVPNAVAVYETFRVGNLSDGFLNIRSGPSLASSIVGKIMRSANGIIQTGELVHDDIDGIDWMPISFGGVTGFVSAGFLIPSGNFSPEGQR